MVLGFHIKKGPVPFFPDSMTRVRIITEETSNLDEDFAKKHRIFIIPFNMLTKDGKLIKISPEGKERIKEGLFRSKDSFFRYLEKIKKKEDIPSTGAVSIERCKNLIKEATKGKRDAVCILFPKELSKIFENVERAAELVSAEMGNKIKIIDSRQVFSAQYLIVKEAAKLAQEGRDEEEIIEEVNRIRTKIHLFVAVYNLRFLRKGERIKRFKKIGSYFADLLRLASIVGMKDGVPTHLFTTPRKIVESRILSEIDKVVGYNEKIAVRINYAGKETKKRAKKIEELIRKRFGKQLRELSSYQSGALIGCYTGPYVLSVAIRKFGYDQIDSLTLARMFERVGDKLRRNESTLNRLNIYPVIDADTGKNLTFTLSDAAKNLDTSSVKKAAQEIASYACENGTGFSGTAMAAYLSGFASCLLRNDVKKLSAEDFVKAMDEGTQSAYESFRNPKEGTILSIMRVSAQRARKCLEKEKDIAEILKEGYLGGVKELLMPEIQEVPILKRKGIVDAGGLGFVYTLEGWLSTLGKEREIEDFIKDFRDKIRIQKSTLGYRIEEARQPGLCLKIKIEGLDEKAREKLVRQLEALPNPIESPLSTVHNILHMHVYNEELKTEVLETCNQYGKASLLKASSLSQKKHELVKNKILTLIGKFNRIPKLVAWSFYWFGLRIVLPFREIRLWKQSRDLNLITKGLEDTAERAVQAVFIFDKKGRIKYFNRAAQEYVTGLGIQEIKKQGDIVLYLHPEFLKETEGKLFSLGKVKPFTFPCQAHTYDLKQLYHQDEHIGARLEIFLKRK